MNFEQIDRLACEYGTPYYLMNGKTFVDNIHHFQRAFKQRYEKLLVIRLRLIMYLHCVG